MAKWWNCAKFYRKFLQRSFAKFHQKVLQQNFIEHFRWKVWQQHFAKFYKKFSSEIMRNFIEKFWSEFSDAKFCEISWKKNEIGEISFRTEIKKTISWNPYVSTKKVRGKNGLIKEEHDLKVLINPVGSPKFYSIYFYSLNLI